MFKRCFQCGLCWNQVKYARITITHVCFIALTLAGSLGRCLNTRPSGLVFKQLPQDPANVNAWKNMCDPYNHLIQPFKCQSWLHQSTMQFCDIFPIKYGVIFSCVMADTTLNVSITTAADDKFCDIFPNFLKQNKVWHFMRTVCWQTILMKKHTLFVIFEKATKF